MPRCAVNIIASATCSNADCSEAELRSPCSYSYLQVQLELAERAAEAGAAALQAGDWELAAGAVRLTSCMIPTGGKPDTLLAL